MRIATLSTAAMLLAFAPNALAQTGPKDPKDNSGMFNGVGTRWWIRVSPNDPAGGQIATRYKNELYQLGEEIIGINLRGYDEDTKTPDMFRIHVYFESTATSNVPASAPVYSSPKILFNGNAAPQRVTFAALAIPSDGRDLFLAIETLSAITAQGDGGAVLLFTGVPPISTIPFFTDRPGARLGVGDANRNVPVADRLLYARPGATAPWITSNGAQCAWLEPIVDAKKVIAAAPTAKTNQVTQYGRGRTGVITGLLSGMNPDLYNHNKQTVPGPRADEFGLTVESSGMRYGDIVVFLVGSGFQSPVKVSGAIGALRVKNPTFVTTRSAIPVDPYNSWGGPATATVLASPRPGLENTDLYWQAAVIRQTGATSFKFIGFSAASIQRL